ncbi:Uncharacterized protein APZ42_002302, partial [Daphnia magna]
PKFAIVEEITEDVDDVDKWVEVVCESWFDGEYCLFPPKSKEKYITTYVKTCHQPDSSWVKYPAKLIKTYASYDEARQKLNKAVKGDDLCTTDADERKKTRKSRMSKFSREDKNEDDDMAINRSKKTSFKRIRQFPASGSEDEMANSPVPPKPPAIALANTKLSSQSNLQSQRSCIKRTKSLPSNSKKPTRNENVRCFPEKQTGLRDTTSKPNDSFKDDSDILSFSDRTHHFSTRYRPVNYGYSVPEFGDEGEFQSMDTDLNQSNSENPANTRINHARHGSEKHSLQPNTSSNSIDTIEDD